MTLRNHVGTRAATLLLLLALLTVCALQAHYYWHYVNDDAYITFRYSRNLADGRGPYFNAGEHVEGYTSFLMMALMAGAVSGLGAASVSVVAKLLGALAAGGAVLVTFLLFRKVFGAAEALYDEASDAGALAAAGIVAVSPAFAANSISGLETSLFSLLLTLAVFLDVTGRERGGWVGSAIAFSLAGLARPEGYVLFGVYWLTRVLVVGVAAVKRSQDERGGFLPLKVSLAAGPMAALARSALLVGCVFLCQMVFRLLAYDGEWLPNTYYAKQGGFWAQAAWGYISAGLLPPILGIAGLVVSVGGYWIARGSLLRSALPVVSVAVAGSCLPLATGTDWMLGWRLVIPYLPLAAVLVAGGWLSLLARIPWPRQGMMVSVITCCIGILWFAQGGVRGELHSYIETRSRGYQTGHVGLAQWLGREAREGEAVALMDIGIVGYLCPRQLILDLTGLTDRFIAKSEGDFLHKSYDPMYVLARRPEFIVITLTAPGAAYHVPPAGTSFRAWTHIETNLAEHPEFVKAYVRRRQPVNPSDWLDVLASQMGAERVFEHAHPGVYYLLAVFRRQHHVSHGLNLGSRPSV